MWDYLKQVNKPIVLYGMGDGALKIMAELKKREIPVAGVFASDGFVRGHSFEGFEVLSYSAARERFGEMCVLLSFGSSRPEVIEAVKKIAGQEELFAPDVPVTGGGIFTREYAAAHREELTLVYERLADEPSKLAFRSIIEYKITGKIEPLFRAESLPEEVYRHILKLGPEESYLDLGAYTGDTIGEFLRETGGRYRAIYAVEPNPKTFRKLRKNTDHLSDCVLFNIGIHSTYAELPFESRRGRGSNLAAVGRVIPVDSVDHILAGREVTYLKMDVEGQEQAAIQGAGKTLTRWRPKLSVAAYHRTEDLFALPLAVWRERQDYKVYLRHFPSLPAWDTNFYFI